MAPWNRSENEEINLCKKTKMLLTNILRILSLRNKVTPVNVRKNIHPPVKERSQNSFMKTPTSNEDLHISNKTKKLSE